LFIEQCLAFKLLHVFKAYPVKTNLEFYFFLIFIIIFSIKVVRSSTNKLQDVYAKAKDTSPLIRLPLNLAEAIADKSLKVALTIVNPFVQPLSGPGKFV